MAGKSTVKIPITISVPEEALAKIMTLDTSEGSDAQKIQRMCNGLIEDVAGGGMMLDGDLMSRIMDSVPEAMEDPDQLAEAIEDGRGRRQGQMVAEWVVDPSMIKPLQDYADQQSVTLEELVQDCMDQAAANGWFYELPAGMTTKFFSPADSKVLAAITEKESMTGEDLVDWICKMAGVSREEPVEQSLLEVLGEPKVPA